MAKTHQKTCVGCGGIAMPGTKYCKVCKKAVLAILREEGYLETGGFGRKGQNRTSEMKENQYETRHGND